MTLEQVFFRTWRVISLPLTIVVLLFCYYTLPDNVAIHHNDFGKPDGFIGKESLFYIVGLIIVVFNVLMSALKNAVMKLPDSVFARLGAWAKNRTTLNNVLDGWISMFVAMVNSFIIICLIGLNRINRNADQILDINYNWLLLIGVALLMLIVFYLPIKFLYTKPRMEE